MPYCVIYRKHLRVRFIAKEHTSRITPAHKDINLVQPLGYLDFLCVTSNARLILTDSGGIQAESTVLGVPCLTLRDNTEWTITLEKGTNTLVWTDSDSIKWEAQQLLDTKPPVCRVDMSDPSLKILCGHDVDKRC